MTDRKAEIIQRLDHSFAVLNNLTDQLTPEQWEQIVQSEGARWTARNLLVHLQNSARGMTSQVQNIVAGHEGAPLDFDINRWNQRMIEKGADKSIPELRQAIEENRQTLLETVAGLSEADLDKRGRHASLQIMSIEEFLNLIASHQISHVNEIAQALNLSVQAV